MTEKFDIYILVLKIKWKEALSYWVHYFLRDRWIKDRLRGQVNNSGESRLVGKLENQGRQRGQLIKNPIKWLNINTDKCSSRDCEEGNTSDESSGIY
jgi:hypothetical protein